MHGNLKRLIYIFSLLKSSDPRMKRIVAVILAAGLSKRFLSNKLLVSINGEPLLRLSIKPFLIEEIEERFVVLGKEKAIIERLLGDLSLRILFNPFPEKGLSFSIKIALPFIERKDGVFFHLADKPLVDSSLVKRMIDLFDSSSFFGIVPTFRGMNGHPVLIDIERFREDIEGLKGDRGLREIIERNREKFLFFEAGDGCIIDIDRKEDLKILKERGFKIEEG